MQNSFSLTVHILILCWVYGLWINNIHSQKCQKPVLHTVFAKNSKSDICCLSDIFSQISDSSGVMMFAKFDQFLREVLKLPTAVFEGPSFGYTEHSVRTCFPQQVRGGCLNTSSPSSSSLSSFKSLIIYMSCLIHVCVCLYLEEDHAEHVFGCVDGRSSPSMPRMAPAHAPTC